MLQIKMPVGTAGLQTHYCTVTHATRQARVIANIQTFIDERNHDAHHCNEVQAEGKVKRNHDTSTLILYYTVDLIIIKKNYHTYH